jgi:transcriptional regulator with GAF, ATPase, and Fis domain
VTDQDGQTQPTAALVEAFAAIASSLHASEDYEQTLRRITETAVATVDGCEAASLSLVQDGGPVTRAATSPLATRGDQMQYDEGEGPCLDAAMHERWLYTPDVATDQRWPRSCGQMHRELGVGSLFSCRLTLDSAPKHTLGGINLYATGPDAFDQDDRMLTILLSSMGALVVDASRRQAQLRAAIESRQVIGEAIGILRYQSNLSSDEAFAVLTRASQRMNIKLREVAHRIVRATPDGTSRR